MSEAKHTQGKAIPAVSSFPPIGPCYSVGMQDTKVAIAVTGKFDESDADISEANARRIAACWNACQDIPTEALEADVPEIFRQINRQEELEAQRDDLLALLKEVAGNFTQDDDLPDNLLPRIDAAIAKVEGGAA